MFGARDHVGAAHAVAPLMVATALAVSCSAPPPPPPKKPEPVANPVDAPVRRFSFTTADGKLITSAMLRGRMTIVSFVASYDAASQGQARFLKELATQHVPRINVLMLVLEPASHLPIVRAFSEALELPFFVALSDAATLAGAGPIPGMNRVPALALLDRSGREVWRHAGLVDRKTLSQEISRRDPQARRAPSPQATGAPD